jgi:hypothetical protein
VGQSPVIEPKARPSAGFLVHTRYDTFSRPNASSMLSAKALSGNSFSETMRITHMAPPKILDFVAQLGHIALIKE